MSFTLFLTRLRKGPQWLRLMCKALLRRDAPVAAMSMELCDDPSVQVMLGARPVFFSRLLRSRAERVVGWGRKWSGRRAVAQGGPFVLLEDGFIRSVQRGDPALSLVVDDTGIFYDGTAPSAVERYIAEPADVDRAARIAQLWRDNRVSKYNAAPEYTGDLSAPYMLVIDQVAGDLSIGFGAADQGQFDKMLQAALVDYPDCEVILKVHPDVYTHARKGHFDLDALAGNPRVRVVAQNCHAVHLIAEAQAVYTVTSQIGFEALIWGKPVHCFGMPFYAGYGLTRDDLAAPERRKPVTLEQLIYGALVRYARYIDPETGALAEPEAVIAHVGLQRRQMLRVDKPLFALGFSRWKRPILHRFIGRDATFVKQIADVPAGAALLIWGSRVIEGLPPDVDILRVEDGFLRSSGLGADLITPMSWVIDNLGIYYDPSQPSRLEAILQSNDFSVDDRHRAQALITQLTKSAVSKYNLVGTDWVPPASDQHLILVPGQVENDASIRLGAVGVCTNLGLLQAVRAAHPAAYIIYKPHPDVVARLRNPGADEAKVHEICDEIVTNTDIIAMIGQVDEVHVMTSLAGFEALIRGVSVTCYGQPFYAGWGLTQDIVSIRRRTTKLSLVELVAGTLIAYPRYVSRVSQRLTTPEKAIAELAEWRANGPSRMPLFRRILRVLLRLWVRSGLKRNA